MLPREGHLLRIFIGERDRHEGVALYEWIVRRARAGGLAGTTVLRGIEGFGARSHMHKASILALSGDLPIVIEIVDSAEKIDAFLPLLDPLVGAGMVTVERVEVEVYRSEDEAST